MHIRLAALAATAVLAGLPAGAHASEPVVVDGCSAAVARDYTPEGQFGGRSQLTGVLWAGPIVITNTDDVMANAVDGTVTCRLSVNGYDQGVVARSELLSYAVATATYLSYTADSDDVVLLCGTLETTDAYDVTRTYDLGCEQPAELPVVPPCAFANFVPQPARPVVEEAFDC